MGQLKSEGDEILVDEAVCDEDRAGVVHDMIQVVLQVSCRRVEWDGLYAVDSRRFHAVVVGQQLVEGQHFLIVKAEDSRVAPQARFVVHDGMQAELFDIEKIFYVFDGDDAELEIGEVEAVKKLSAHGSSSCL